MEETVKKILENEFSYRKTSILKLDVLKNALKTGSKDLLVQRMIAQKTGFLECINNSHYFGRPISVWPHVQWFPTGNKVEFEENDRFRAESVTPMISMIFIFVVNVFDILKESRLPIDFLEQIIEAQFSQGLIESTVRTISSHFRDMNYLYALHDDNGVHTVSLVDDENLVKIIFGINSLLRIKWKLSRTNQISQGCTEDYCVSYEEFYQFFIERYDDVVPETCVRLEFLKTKETLKTFLNIYTSVFRFDGDEIRSVCSLTSPPICSGFSLEPDAIVNFWTRWNFAKAKLENDMSPPSSTVDSNGNGGDSGRGDSDYPSTSYDSGFLSHVSRISEINSQERSENGKQNLMLDNLLNELNLETQSGETRVSSLERDESVPQSAKLYLRSPFFAAKAAGINLSESSGTLMRQEIPTRLESDKPQIDKNLNPSTFFDDNISDEFQARVPVAIVPSLAQSSECSVENVDLIDLTEDK